MIGGVAFPVTQNPASNCFFSLTSDSVTFPTAASTGSVGINASLPSCSWTATSDSPSFLTITSGSSGTGNGAIQFSVAANSGDGRSATITAGNQTSSPTFTVKQASVNTCTFTLTPNPVNVSSEGASGAFSILPPYQLCAWTASSNDPSAITITSNPSGRGTGSITYVVTQNPGSAPRTLTITAGCQTFTVHQNGVVSGPPDLAMGKSHAGSFTVGINGVYTLTVTNVGSGPTTGAITVTDTLPNGLTFVSGTGTGWVCSASGQVVTCTNPVPFAPNAVSTITLTVGTGTAGSVTNSVMVSTAGDSNPNNNSASDATTINNPSPTLTNISPNAGYVGQAVSMTMTGTGFNSSSVVKFGATPNSGGTTSGNGATLTISIPGTELSPVGIASVNVSNPTPGGGTSAGQNFAISDFAVTSPTGEQTKPAGTPAMFEIDLATQGGPLPSDATLSMMGLPPASNFMLTTTTFTKGTNAGMSTLTIALASAYRARGAAPAAPPDSAPDAGAARRRIPASSAPAHGRGGALACPGCGPGGIPERLQWRVPGEKRAHRDAGRDLHDHGHGHVGRGSTLDQREANSAVGGRRRRRDAMCKRLLLLVVLTVGLAIVPAAAQQTPRVDLSAGYTYVRSNIIVPSGCCFSLNGGSGSVAYNLNDWFGVVADFGASHSGNAKSTGRTLTVVTYLFGPRFSYRKHERVIPFAQVLLGGGHAGGTLYSSPGGLGAHSAFAMTAGGGLDVKVRPHFSVRLFQAEYFLSEFKNGTNNRQNNFRLTVGVVFHLGTR